MGQLHALEIHFERQPGQVCAVGNSEQSFGNSVDRFLNQAFVPLRISDVLRHTHLSNGVANVVVQKCKFQGVTVALLVAAETTVPVPPPAHDESTSNWRPLPL